MSGRPIALRGNGGQGRGGRGRGRPNAARKPQAKPQVSTKKFQGNHDKLQGCIFDCSDSRQADLFVTTLKRISEHLGSEYKHGGDIRSSILNETKFTIPVPVAPTIVDAANLTAVEVVGNMIFKEKWTRILNVTPSWTITSRRPIHSSSVSVLICFRAR